MKTFFVGLVCLSTAATAAFVGYGAQMYYPVCCHACYASIGSAPLSCSTEGHGGGHSHGAPPTSPECRAGDTPFLTTLAYCISSKCSDVPLWELEKYWAQQTTGDPFVPPKWSYDAALQQVTTAPNSTYEAGTILNHTVLVDPASYEMQRKFMVVFEKMETIQIKYVFVLLIIGFTIPIFFTLLKKLPFMTGVFDKVNPYLYLSTIGTYHVRPLPWLLGNAPTIGQAFYLAIFIILNIVLTAVGYESAQPHPWGYNQRGELLAYAGYRTGHIAFALLPLVILFSARNNFLLWVTNWTHSTYMLLHRWVAWIFAIQTILHSVFLLAAYKQSGIYSVNYYEPYWLWGIVGTVFVCAMLVFSILWLRRLAYELFLISHIIMAVFVIVGSWYHVYYRFGLPGSYEYWLYAASAVWFFDRLLRVLRITKNGMRRATVTDVGPNHVRVDIQGLRWAAKPGFHAYAYFPMLNPLRPWENHPFSVNSTALFRSREHSISTPSDSIHASPSGRDVEKESEIATERETRPADEPAGSAGITLIIRRSAGLTRLLQKHASLLTLIDGPYLNNPSEEILKCDRVLLIGGGIGITGLLGWLNAHRNVKLAWSVKQRAEAVVQEVDVVLKEVADKEVRIGQRLDVSALLRHEVEAGWTKVGVVACGPGGLCDSVRAEVARLGRHEKTVFELEVDAYSW